MSAPSERPPFRRQTSTTRRSNTRGVQGRAWNETVHEMPPGVASVLVVCGGRYRIASAMAEAGGLMVKGPGIGTKHRQPTGTLTAGCPVHARHVLDLELLAAQVELATRPGARRVSVDRVEQVG